MKKGWKEQRKRDLSSVRGGKPSGKRLFEMKDDRNQGQKSLKKEHDRRESGGKGDAPRNNSSEAWHKNYSLIDWGKKRKKKSKSGKFTKKYK